MVKVIDGHMNVRGYVRTNMFLSGNVLEDDLWRAERLVIQPNPQTGEMTYTFYNRAGVGTSYTSEAK